ncbi:hypothetical protein MRB53_002171 [Persea americana]|uniref:Uncharacterized protein n=1 Tax=Persea americana TaxID=3435 RepID=A0ACC2MU29_PERAE|nr:hypothetical protein MRB53_002171 [Persea americana]
MTIAELSRQLIVTEEIMKKEQNPLMIEKSFARTKPKGKDRDSKKKSVIKGPKVENGSTCGMSKAKGTRVKEKYFHYSMIGHWKRNCPDLLSRKRTSGMIESLVSEVSFATGTSESWCVDFGATNHTCNTLQELQVTRRISGGEIITNLGLEAKANAVTVGVREQKVLIGTDAVLLKEDYMIDRKSLEKAIPEELEQDPCNYDEAINDIDSGSWQDAMKAKMESMYSNQVNTSVIWVCGSRVVVDTVVLEAFVVLGYATVLQVEVAAVAAVPEAVVDLAAVVSKAALPLVVVGLCFSHPALAS